MNSSAAVVSCLWQIGLAEKLAARTEMREETVTQEQLERMKEELPQKRMEAAKSWKD